MGDLMRLEEKPDIAVEEYSKALNIRERLCKQGDRGLCDAHFCLATAFIDLSSKKEASEVARCKESALSHYRTARDVLIVERNESKDHSETSELIDELTETIQALEVELADSKLSTKSSSVAPVTTIGFGPSTSMNTSNDSSKRVLEAPSSAVPNTLQVRP